MLAPGMYGNINIYNLIRHLQKILVILTSCALVNYIINYVDAGASTTSKNLVNLSSSSESNGINSGINNSASTTSSNQFQNEYQINRQNPSKSSPNDRHKTSTFATGAANEGTTTTSPTRLFDHLTSSYGDNAVDTSDYPYPYQDGRVITNVPDCKGRLMLNGTRGFITDGPGYYQTNLQCIWLIDSGLSNATIRLQLHQFSTECNYDFLYVFDGDSVYSPLVAALSGDIKDFSSALQEARIEDMISAPTTDNYSEIYSASSTTTSTTTTPTTTNLSPTTQFTSTTNNNNNIDNSTSNTSSLASKTKNAYGQQESLQQQQLVELKTHSGKAFIYFHSDTAQTMPGFYMTYSIDSCPLDCSNRGDCDYKSLTCKCNSGYFGDGCQYIFCPNNCTSPIHGTCDKDKSCVCNHDFAGPDCSRRADQQSWHLIARTNQLPPRAFHRAVAIDQIMWVFGGRSQALSNTNSGIYRHNQTSMILSYDIQNQKWTHFKTNVNSESGTDSPSANQEFVGETGQDHLAELSGHSVAVSGTKVFIYGGMAMNNTILNTLTAFDTKTKTFNIISSSPTATISTDSNNIMSDHTSSSAVAGVVPLAVAGHSANIVDGYMYVFLGYNPLYGYLNFAQKFNIANNTWSRLERRGSSVVGCIGHTSTFDPASRLIYIYGGHNAHRSSRLYSFNPQTEVWTYLQSSPSSRYYHSAIIMNGLLIILGGNSYNTSHQSDQCFQQRHLIYDLSCGMSSQSSSTASTNQTSATATCGRKCWSSINDDGYGTLKRHGHSIVTYNNNQELILYGGFNGIILNDLQTLRIQSCANFTSEQDCLKPKLGIICSWNSLNMACEFKDKDSFGQTGVSPIDSSASDSSSCTKKELQRLQLTCEARETCTDCLSTSLGCVWCGVFWQCQYAKCRLPNGEASAVTSVDMCYKDTEGSSSSTSDSGTSLMSPSFNLSSFINYHGPNTHPGFRMASNNHAGPTSSLINIDHDKELDCRVDNCYLCQSRPYCSWLNDGCSFNPSAATQPSSTSHNMLQNSLSSAAQTSAVSPSGEELDPSYFRGHPWHPAINSPNQSRTSSTPASTTTATNGDLFFFHNVVAPRSGSSISPYHSCDIPCFMRNSCNQCTTTKCIWCSTTEQCIDSSAYFAYHAMGQCMHYVAHMLKCPVASCSDIETCDECLTNPRCGWLNDISNTGQGRCMDGASNGPMSMVSPVAATVGSNSSFSNNSEMITTTTTALNTQPAEQQATINNWYYTQCPSCQCNGHSYCKLNSSVCLQPCQGNTEGAHCDRCQSGYFGDPVNGGKCQPCKCNSHAQSCNRETGKCYCSTKGIIGHNCNKCDDKNYYIGDPNNGTCYYNLTTDFQYTFNMSKPEDHFYSDINFINLPIRKDSDLDFAIACSRLALVNITAGTNFKSRRNVPYYSNLECGSFRLRFPYDRHPFNDANYSFYVQVYKFQTPFILQISFSQHRTIYLPQFFFTFSSSFLFFFALSGIIWKLKHEYDVYVRRQRQFIEMEQMASRPFSTILLDMFRGYSGYAGVPLSSSSGSSGDAEKKMKMEKNKNKANSSSGNKNNVAYKPVPSQNQQPPTPADVLEPTPISFEPCFGGNVGVLSLFVKLPGRPNLAIGSALVSLNDNGSTTNGDTTSGGQTSSVGGGGGAAAAAATVGAAATTPLDMSLGADDTANTTLSEQQQQQQASKSSIIRHHHNGKDNISVKNL